MARKRHTPEQIIRMLREAEVELAKGRTTTDVVRKLGIAEQSIPLAGARSTGVSASIRPSA
jgi:hypothetical protein